MRSLESQTQQQLEVAGLITSIGDFRQRVQSGLAQANFEQKRQLVELLIDRVIITGEEVEIRYVIPTSDKSEHIRCCNLRKDYTCRLPYPDKRHKRGVRYITALVLTLLILAKLADETTLSGMDHCLRLRSYKLQSFVKV